MDLQLNQGEAVYTGPGKALSGGDNGSMVIVGDHNHGGIELRCASGEVIRGIIGSVEVFTCEVVNGTPVITFTGLVRSLGYEDTTPQPPAAPRP